MQTARCMFWVVYTHTHSQLMIFRAEDRMLKFISLTFIMNETRNRTSALWFHKICFGFYWIKIWFQTPCVTTPPQLSSCINHMWAFFSVINGMKSEQKPTVKKHMHHFNFLHIFLLSFLFNCVLCNHYLHCLNCACLNIYILLFMVFILRLVMISRYYIDVSLFMFSRIYLIYYSIQTYALPKIMIVL